MILIDLSDPMDCLIREYSENCVKTHLILEASESSGKTLLTAEGSASHRKTHLIREASERHLMTRFDQNILLKAVCVVS